MSNEIKECFNKLEVLKDYIAYCIEITAKRKNILDIYMETGFILYNNYSTFKEPMTFEEYHNARKNGYAEIKKADA